MNLFPLYASLPYPAQNIACSLKGWLINRSRYTPEFFNLLDQYQTRYFLDQQSMIRFRDERLRKFVCHAVTTTEYYSNLFRKLKISPDDIKTLSNLAVLPVLTKSEIQESPGSFRSKSFSSFNIKYASTSGTTGAGLKVAYTNSFVREQYAVWWRYWMMHGISLGTWCAFFGGNFIVPNNQVKPPYWRINHAGRQVRFSIWHNNPENIIFYLNELRARKLPWIHGRPSQISWLAANIIEKKFDLGYAPKWISVGTEKLLPLQVYQIEKAFGVKPIQHYGTVEGCANISQCPSGNLHVDEDFSAVEFSRDDVLGSNLIVGTNFSNYAMPLLRYNLNDRVKEVEESCNCGRPGRVLKEIDGREDDYVISKSGKMLTSFNLVFDKSINILEAQIRQDRPGYVDLLIVKSERFSAEDEKNLVQEFQSRVGNDVDLTLHYVDRVPKTPNGKLKLVVNTIEKSS